MERRSRWQKRAEPVPEPEKPVPESTERAAPEVDSDSEGFWDELPPSRAQTHGKPVDSVDSVDRMDSATGIRNGNHDHLPSGQPAVSSSAPVVNPRWALPSGDVVRGPKVPQKQRKQHQSPAMTPAEQPEWSQPEVSRTSRTNGYQRNGRLGMRELEKWDAEQTEKQQSAGQNQLIHMEELHPGVEEEKGVLEAIYGAEFEILGAAEWRIRFPSPHDSALRLLLPAGYPCTEPPVPIFDCEGASEPLRRAAADAICELTENWEPPMEGEGCIYQWVERLRECLEPALALEVAQREESDESYAVALQAQEAYTEASASKGFTFLPANPQYGQRRRTFDDTAFEAANAVEIKRGEPFTDRKSTFQAFAAKVSNQGQVNWALRMLLEDRKIAVATHNMFAYRFRDEARGIQVADNEDDGEDGAGSKLAELLQLADCEDVFVMVSRWYGGIHLGSDRFKHISRAALSLLDEHGWSGRSQGRGAPKKKK